VRALGGGYAWRQVSAPPASLCPRTKLFSCYAALGDLASARMVFDGTPRPDAYSKGVMLGCLVQMERHAEAVALQ